MFFLPNLVDFRGFEWFRVLGVLNLPENLENTTEKCFIVFCYVSQFFRKMFRKLKNLPYMKEWMYNLVTWSNCSMSLRKYPWISGKNPSEIHFAVILLLVNLGNETCIDMSVDKRTIYRLNDAFLWWSQTALAKSFSFSETDSVDSEFCFNKWRDTVYYNLISLMISVSKSEFNNNSPEYSLSIKYTWIF